jgi:hypothetical protein
LEEKEKLEASEFNKKKEPELWDFNNRLNNRLNNQLDQRFSN